MVPRVNLMLAADAASPSCLLIGLATNDSGQWKFVSGQFASFSNVLRLLANRGISTASLERFALSTHGRTKRKELVSHAATPLVLLSATAGTQIVATHLLAIANVGLGF
jgi:hypothetical protein